MKEDVARLTFKHVNAGLGRVPHRIHEDWWQKLSQQNPDLGTIQLVGQQLGEEIGRFLASSGVAGTAVEVQQVDQCA